MLKVDEKDIIDTKSNTSAIKYHTPKMLLVDVNEDVEKNLKAEGFNVEVGTFGSIYHSESHNECELNGNLPFITESDLVIVHLHAQQKHIGSQFRPLKSCLKGARTVFTTPRDQNYFDGRMAYSYMNKKTLIKS
ncbi:hypothetical protein BN2127_JRS1_05137 [Bacillus cereus]|nr:hypothetical protein BN2127_JRS1_05137 [Bacillus cereus]